MCCVPRVPACHAFINRTHARTRVQNFICSPNIDHSKLYYVHISYTVQYGIIVVALLENGSSYYFIFLRDLLKMERDELLNSNFWPLGGPPSHSLGHHQAERRGAVIDSAPGVKGTGGIRGAQKQLRPHHPILLPPIPHFLYAGHDVWSRALSRRVRPIVRAGDRSTVVVVVVVAATTVTAVALVSIHTRAHLRRSRT